MYYKKLVGERLYLSPIDIENEVKTMTKWMNEDEDIAHFNGFYGSLLGEEKVREMMSKWNEGPFIFSIVSQEKNEFMGHVSLFGMDSHEQFVTMGIYLGKEFRHCGYGQEAIRLLLRYIFDFQRFNAIHLEVFSFNKNAIKAYQKLGFKECGRWHKVKYHQGQLHDIIMMELLREDFK